MVDGYGASAGGDNLRIAAIRSNRVKSELLCGVGFEKCFVTHNHASGEQQEQAATSDFQETTVQETVTTPQETNVKDGSGAATQPSQSGDTRHGGLSLRANLLRWATLTPDRGF